MFFLQKYLFSNGKWFSQPKYHILRWKTVTVNLKLNFTNLRGKQSKNARKNEKFRKTETKIVFFSWPKDDSGQKYIPMSKTVLCSLLTDRQTDAHKSDYWKQPFRVSGVFPSTYHQGSARKDKNWQWHDGMYQYVLNH